MCVSSLPVFCVGAAACACPERRWTRGYVHAAGPTTGGTIGVGTAFTPNRLASSCDSPSASMGAPSQDTPWVPDAHARGHGNAARLTDGAKPRPVSKDGGHANARAAAQHVFEPPQRALGRVFPHVLQSRLQSQLSNMAHPTLWAEDQWRGRALSALSRDPPFKHLHCTVCGPQHWQRVNTRRAGS